jgi:three-Cys-motif partner protein
MQRGGAVADEGFLFEADDLSLPTVGSWAQTKHAKVRYYSELFSKSMKNRWDCRVYLDLFAGAGKARVKATGKVIPGSPLLALSVDDPFDKYVFCEQDESNISALRERVDRHFPSHQVEYFHGDSNEKVEEVLSLFPQFSAAHKGLTLCFVDPFKMAQLQFATLARIAEALYVDFLILIPTYMDIHRNESTYLKLGCPTLDLLLGGTDWRERWPDPDNASRDFGLFVADEFGKKMQEIGFLYKGLGDLELVRMIGDRNQPLYHLAFFSKHELGLRFWRETRRNTNNQLSLLD